MNHQVAILILHFKDNPHTLPCLNSLSKVTHPSFKTYILSIQSHNLDKLKTHPLKPVMINTSLNLGFAWANNLLIKQAFKDGYQTVILLNNDTTVDPDFIPPLLHQLESTNVAMVSPKIFFYPGNEFHHQDYHKSEIGKVIWYMGGIVDWSNVYASHHGVDEVDHGQFNQANTTDFVTGCCLAVSQKTIEKIGLMDEKYFLYYEDTDWSVRAIKSGYKIMVEPKSVIYHKNAGSTKGSGSSLQVYYQTRNRYYFGMKYAPIRTKFHLLKNTLKSITSPDKIVGQAARDAFFGHMGFSSKPL